MSFIGLPLGKRVYNSLEELQADLDDWLTEYNEERTHQGKYCFGKTPMQTFKDSLHLVREKMLDLKFHCHFVPIQADSMRVLDKVVAITALPNSFENKCTLSLKGQKI